MRVLNTDGKFSGANVRKFPGGCVMCPVLYQDRHHTQARAVLLVLVTLRSRVHQTVNQIQDQIVLILDFRDLEPQVFRTIGLLICVLQEETLVLKEPTSTACAIAPELWV